ncbi:MAG: phosphatidylglycerophosphatase A [Nitrospirae bacterium]|nr:phosphatidylglycerophosphatase A [Nitrospirota bacterium]
MMSIVFEKPLNKLIIFLATGFYAGYLPYAPGTFGSLIGVGLFFIINGLSPVYYLIVLFLLFSLGVYISDRAEALFAKKDSTHIIFDEIAGLLVAMALIPNGIGWIIAGFFLFRLFDIFKPYPIRDIEKKFNGGLGIMLDDVAAGVYTNILLQAVRLYVG